MAFNLTSINQPSKVIRQPSKVIRQPAQVLTNHEMRKAQAEVHVNEENIPLKPLSLPGKPLGKKVQYYIEMWNIGNQTHDLQASTFHTANLKHAVKIILKAGISIVFLKRMTDGRVILDRR